jgi:hypothetical protein
MTSTNALIKITALIFALILLALLLSYPAMLLWNGCLVPAIPALAPVSWLQMFGIQVLLSILVPRASVDRSSK